MSKINYRTTVRRPEHKAKKSYTLSPESVKFLEMLRKKRRAPSASSVLDDLLQALRRDQLKRRLDKAVGDYYSELSVEEREEQRAWGEFALRNFPREG
jgi:hypothetical protein